MHVYIGLAAFGSSYTERNYKTFSTFFVLDSEATDLATFVFIEFAYFIM